MRTIKKILLLIFLLLPSVAMARTGVMRLLMSMERLQRADSYLEAMDSATLVLTIDEDNRTAKEFVYRHWDNMMEHTREQLTANSDLENLEQTARRCEIYRLLDEIYTHLYDVSLPLYGPDNRWVWQPEMAYYSGHYDEERNRTYHLLMRKVEEALRSYDSFTAQQYMQQALDKYLITEGERESNKKEMIRQCNENIARLGQSEQIHQAIFAYELIQLSLALDATQDNLHDQQTAVQKHIADLYLQKAAVAQAMGDTIQAEEYRLSAKDWN